MTITVVNVRTAKRGTYVYCGRRNARYGLPQSPLANPYVLRNEGERTQVLEAYQRWFDAQVQKGNPTIVAELAYLKDKAAQGDLYLGCWCKDGRKPEKACHCDIIKSHLETNIR